MVVKLSFRILAAVSTSRKHTEERVGLKKYWLIKEKEMLRVAKASVRKYFIFLGGWN
jgi:hypothetical protein